MNGRKLDEYTVRASLSRKRDVQIMRDFETGINYVYLLTRRSKQRQHDLGNKSWGMIDFLINHCGYIPFWVTEFKK